MTVEQLSNQLLVPFPDVDELAYRPRQLYWPDPKRREFANLGDLPFINVINFLEEGTVHYILEYHCEWFDLEKEEDRLKYCLVNQRAANGWYNVEQQQYQTVNDKFCVWLEWKQAYGEWIPAPEDLLE